LSLLNEMWRRLAQKRENLATPTKRRNLPLKEELKFLEFLAAETGKVAAAPAGSQVSRFSRWTLNLLY